LEEFENTMNPDHQATGFSTDCASCHTTDPGWMPATFDHDAQFFPIYSGEHNGVWSDCVECHPNPSNYAEFTCITCHANPDTDNDHFGVPGYIYESTACLVCHPTGDGDEGFNHDNTDFPLMGGHLGVDCLECHADGFAGTPTECAACHLDDFNNTTEPDHNESGFPTDCAQCHTEDSWVPALFDHDDTAFPLMGGHVGVNCLECHADGYAGTPTECAACHLEDYNNTSEPDHNDAGFSTDCAACHTEQAWEPATFDHDDTAFPLMGGHVGVNCLECHADGYAGTPTECVACHLNDYNSTNNPDHESAQFPTDCASCHNETAWEPSTFDHDAQHFPIYSGAHEGEWNQCVDCHINPNDFSVFSCTVCHNQADSDDDHDEVNGYVYESNACFECHPDGSD
jgi:hypothetical protein